MIKLTRERSETAIKPVFRGQRRIELNAKLIREHIEILNNTKEKHSWDSNVWGASKEQLLIESNNKCAYCEAPLKAVAYGDVEHYRPKSIYWWLAYNYENYLVSCTLCNQAFKKDKFPLDNPRKIQGGPVLRKNYTDKEINKLAPVINPDPLEEPQGMAHRDFLGLHSGEGALLVNPYYDDPEEIFEYQANDVLKEVEIKVKPGVVNAQKIQKAIVDDYGLNRLELKQLRYEWYDLYFTHKLVLKENAVSSNLKDRANLKIGDLKKNNSPFAGMIRYFEKILSLVILILITSFSSFSQVSFTHYDTINPGVPVNLSGVSGLTAIGLKPPEGNTLGDWRQGPFPIGFDFTFFGTKYTRFWIGANGWISFLNDSVSQNGTREQSIPCSGLYCIREAIFGPLQDFYPNDEGSPYIFYQTIGQMPNRKLVVLWCQCPLHFCLELSATFQIILNENGNTIENQIFHKPACTNTTVYATLGIVDASGQGYCPDNSYNLKSWGCDTLAFRYVPQSSTTYTIEKIPFMFQFLIPGEKITYRWYAGTEFISDQQNAVVAPMETTTYTGYCTLCSGQEFLTETVVFVKPGIPNAFSPNGDGLNDIFHITGLPPENITLFNLQIFNRWGQMVFQTQDIRQGWDGTQNGVLCPVDYYTWVIFYEDSNKRRISNKGGLLLVR